MLECPSRDAAKVMADCTTAMNNGQQCEADQNLPDGNTSYNINNCGVYDIFKCESKYYLIYLKINIVVEKSFFLINM